MLSLLIQIDRTMRPQKQATLIADLEREVEELQKEFGYPSLPPCSGSLLTWL